MFFFILLVSQGAYSLLTLRIVIGACFSSIKLKIFFQDSSGAAIGLIFEGQTRVADQTFARGRRPSRGTCSSGKFLKSIARKRHFMATKGRE